MWKRSITKKHIQSLLSSFLLKQTGVLKCKEWMPLNDIRQKWLWILGWRIPTFLKTLKWKCLIIREKLKVISFDFMYALFIGICFENYAKTFKICNYFFLFSIEIFAELWQKQFQYHVRDMFITHIVGIYNI